MPEPLSFSVTFDPLQLDRVRRELADIKNGLAIAAQASLSNTLDHARTLISKKIREEVNLPKNRVDATAFKIVKPSLKNLEGSITLTQDKPVWLSEYVPGRKRLSALGKYVKAKKGKGKRPKVPVSVQVRRRGDLPKYPTVLPHAFWAVMPQTGRFGIFQRTGEKRKMASGKHFGKTREAIRMLQGPGAVGVFLNAKGEQGTQKMFDETLSDLGAWLEKKLSSQLSYLLAKRNLAAGRLANFKYTA